MWRKLSLMVTDNETRKFENVYASIKLFVKIGQNVFPWGHLWYQGKCHLHKAVPRNAESNFLKLWGFKANVLSKVLRVFGNFGYIQSLKIIAESQKKKQIITIRYATNKTFCNINKKEVFGSQPLNVRIPQRCWSLPLSRGLEAKCQNS